MAVASLVLGIIALVFTLFGTWAWLGLILGIVGIILGAQAKKTQPSGIATAGFVCSLIAVILCGLVAVSCTLCTACACASSNALFK